jgi:hypothetical protein
VRAGPREGGFALGDPSNRDGPLERVGHLEVVHHVTQGALDPDDVHVDEACRGDFAVKLTRSVSPGRCESVSRAMYTGVDDRSQPSDGVLIPGPDAAMSIRALHLLMAAAASSPPGRNTRCASLRAAAQPPSSK